MSQLHGGDMRIASTKGIGIYPSDTTKPRGGRINVVFLDGDNDKVGLG